MKTRAAVLEEISKPLVIRDIDVATPEGREVLIEVKASGICHSDMFAAEHASGWPMPVVLGHEVAGIVKEIGPNVTSLRVGDHVVACEIESCGHCDDCVRGRPYQCQFPHEIMRGSHQPPRLSLAGKPVMQFSGIGGFMEHVLLHENACVTIDSRLSFDKAAVLGCSVVTGAGAAINAADVRVGDTVAVLGCGGVGLNAIQGALLAGARRVIAIDILARKLDLAARFGATDVINAAETDAVAAVMETTRGLGVDYAFECAGQMASTEQAIAMTRPTGTTFLIGIQKPENVLALRPFADLLIAKKSVKSVFMGSSNFKYDIPLFIDLYQQGRFNLDDLVSATIPLDQIHSGFDALHAGEVARTVITF